MSHGGPDADQRHAGDLGNLEADAGGVANYDRIDSGIQLTGENSILGRAVIVHASEDDLTTQPTGAAGARLACGVIKEAP
jgi:Cu-Zn family superoxide dismutase